MLNKKPYSNANVVSLFEEHMYLCKQIPVSDKKHLNSEEKAEVLRMAPLVWETGWQLEFLMRLMR